MAGTRRTQGILGGRSDDVVERVLEAALAEVARAGYAGFRIADVATQANVHKTTIYRRWPDRAALVGAVVDRMRQPIEQTPLPDTGALETDLLEAFSRRATFGRKREGQAWAMLLAERHSEEVSALIGHTVFARRDAWHAMIERAADRGEIPRDTDGPRVLHLIRALVDAQPGDAAWLGVAVRTVLAGVRAGTVLRETGPAAR